MPPTSAAASADRRSGSTLIEVVAVLALVAAMAAVATAAVPGTGRPRLESLAVETAALLRRERWRALVTGTQRVVRLDPVGRRIVTPSGSLAIPPDVVVTVTGAVEDGDADQVMRFFPDGSSSGGVVSLRKEGTAHDILVNWLSGRVSTRARPVR